VRFGYLGIPSLARTPGRATTFCGGAENDCFVIAFFAEFDPVEYNFDDDGASFDVVFIIVLIISIAWFLSTPLVPGVVIIFIIVLSHDDDDAAADDDEKRFLPNCNKRLLVNNAFDALVVRVVRYKSIVFVVTERVREKRISVCLVFFQKELPFWRKRPIRKASQKRISLEHFA
jgi:hypothetical protein